MQKPDAKAGQCHYPINSIRNQRFNLSYRKRLNNLSLSIEYRPYGRSSIPTSQLVEVDRIKKQILLNYRENDRWKSFCDTFQVVNQVPMVSTTAETDKLFQTGTKQARNKKKMRKARRSNLIPSDPDEGSDRPLTPEFLTPYQLTEPVEQRKTEQRAAAKGKKPKAKKREQLSQPKCPAINTGRTSFLPPREKQGDAATARNQRCNTITLQAPSSKTTAFNSPRNKGSLSPSNLGACLTPTSKLPNFIQYVQTKKVIRNPVNELQKSLYTDFNIFLSNYEEQQKNIKINPFP